MNHVFILSITLVALIGFVGAGADNTRLDSIIPTDDEELKNVSPKNKIFYRYCTGSRDEVKSFLSTITDEQTLDVYLTMFNSVNRLDDSKPSTKKAWKGFLDATQSATFERLDLLKSQFGASGLKEKIESACGSISAELKSLLEKKFVSTKDGIKANSERLGAFMGAESLDAVKSAQYDKLNCLTADRVLKVQNFCDFLKVSKVAVYKVVGL